MSWSYDEALNRAKRRYEETLIVTNAVQAGSSELRGMRSRVPRPLGMIHAMSLTCTHMGCSLKWNPAETSWDCPCHGSRFTRTGEVIEGPAIQPFGADPVEDRS